MSYLYDCKMSIIPKKINSFSPLLVLAGIPPILQKNNTSVLYFLFIITKTVDIQIKLFRTSEFRRQMRCRLIKYAYFEYFSL